MRVCTKCKSGPHHGPCGAWEYAISIGFIVVLAMLVSTFILDFYIQLGWIVLEE